MTKLEEFLEENSIFFKNRENSVTLICPQCSKQKLDIHKEELNFICYFCADNGTSVRGPNATKILSEISGISYGIVKRKLTGFVSLWEFANSSLTSKKPLEQKTISNVVSVPEGTYRLTSAIALPGVEYLVIKRGIPLDVALKYDIRYQVSKKNLVLPVFDDKKLVGYQTRCIDPKCPKAFQKLTMKEFEKSDYLMFENSIVGDSVILAEGPISALKFARTGIGFVASMGKYVSDNQITRLKDRGIKKVYLALDDDAYEETYKLMKRFESDFDFYLLQLNDNIKKELENVNKPDFGDCTFEQISLILTEAIPFNESTAFLINSERLFK